MAATKREKMKIVEQYLEKSKVNPQSMVLCGVDENGQHWVLAGSSNSFVVEKEDSWDFSERFKKHWKDGK